MYKVGFILDIDELFNFCKNEPNTTFLLMNECKARNHKVYAIPVENLFLKDNISGALAYSFEDLNTCKMIQLNELDMVLIRQNPPVDMNYIFSLHILDYIDQSKTILINNPSGIRNCCEKLYIQNFPEIAPRSITTSNISLIKSFLDEQNEIIIKPLDNFAGNGIFYLKKGDKNLNSILEKVTNNGKIIILAQEYLHKIAEGDKRIILLGGKPVAAIARLPKEDDFRANMCKGGSLKSCEITDGDRKICDMLANNLVDEGIFFAGLDIIDNKVIEINVTSPGFFIRKINEMFNIKLETKVVDYMEWLLSCRKNMIFYNTQMSF